VSPSFFEQQEAARRASRRMVLLFVLAVLAVVLAVDLVVAAVYAAQSWGDAPGRIPFLEQLWRVPAPVLLAGALGTAVVILLVSALNIARLAGGGAAVARMVGARAVDPATHDPLERRLLNVVEEMAIASGVRVPAVYVMDGEPGINAFAAGWDASGAVVAVTRGTLETLTRDELQGVIAHEFSHILNGDMRLNIRMLGVLAGIVFIGAIGEFLMRGSRGSRKGGQQLFLAGLAVFIVGYVGLFFARLIKAAASREREFLADASSVQFTRNPDGIAGALDQIRLAGAGALIQGRYAEDLSHMFFGQSVKVRLAGLFDTHPPLDARIRRVHPRFDGATYRTSRLSPTLTQEGREPAEEGPGPAHGRRAGDVGTAWGRSAAESARLVGTLDAAKVGYAARLLEALPLALREAVREPAGAAAGVIALLLAPNEEARAQQLAAAGASELAARAAALAAHARGLGPAFRLPLVDLALPALKNLAQPGRQELLSTLEAVVNADRRVALHEFVVLTLVRTQLEPQPAGPRPQRRNLVELQQEAALILMLVAHAGRRADAQGARQAAREKALTAGAKEMGIRMAVRPAITAAGAREALERLNGLAPLQKARLVRGLFAAATADGEIRLAEAEVLRLVCAVLETPLPPLLERLSFSPASS
jgi:Zn-dependent protease with chaperone function